MVRVTHSHKKKKRSSGLAKNKDRGERNRKGGISQGIRLQSSYEIEGLIEAKRRERDIGG